MKSIKKQTSLRDILRTLPSGVPHEIKNKEYRPLAVRKAVSALRKEGYQFEATEDGLIDSIKVTRLK